MREDWIDCTFEDVFSIITNGSSIKQYDDKSGVPVSRIETIWNENIDWKRVKYALDYRDDLHQKYLLKYGDILFSHINSDSHLGKTAIFKESKKLLHGINLLLLRPFESLNSTFILYYLRFTKINGGFLSIAQRSVNQSSINQRALKQLKIILPPRSEQRAIVKKIEQLFSALDASIADLKKVQEQLKIYRQAVLKKAFDGELTKINIDKYKKVSEFAAMNPKVDKETVFETLECQFIPMKLVEEKINKIHLTEIRKYSELQGKSYTYFQNGDLIFAKVTPCMENGKIAVAKGLKNNIAFGSSEFHVIRCSENILPEYLFHFFVQDKFRIEAEQSMTGAVGLRRVPKKFIEESVIPLPTLEEQHQIVKEIESRLSVCDAVEQQIKTSLDKAEALRQSILKKAFAGALLTQQELEACRKDPDYEPASVLLEKIKAEKQNGKKKVGKEKAIIPAKSAVAAIEKISTDIQAGLIAKVIQLHEDNPQHHTLLTHIKCEKLSHLVEYHLQIPLGRQPVKDAAGPDDYPRLKKVEHRAKMAGYFSVQKNKIGHTYVSGKGIGKAITQFEKNLSEEQKQRVDQLLHLFLTFDLEQAEIVATVYAAWNNLLILGKNKPTDQEIVQEARYNWSDRKLGLEEHRFYKAIEWMQKDTVNLVPTGYGTLVDFPKKKK